MLAAVFTVVWPEDAVAPATSDVEHTALRWGHAGAWLLLAASAVVRGLGAVRAATALALVAAGAYAAFVVALVG